MVTLEISNDSRENLCISKMYRLPKLHMTTINQGTAQILQETTCKSNGISFFIINAYRHITLKAYMFE